MNNVPFARASSIIIRGKGMGSPMAGMDFKIPTVLTSEELMEKAFHRASKIRKNGT